MKIRNNRPPGGPDVSRLQRDAKNATFRSVERPGADGPGIDDKVDPSDGALRVGGLREEIDRLSEERIDRVREIACRIKAGAYVIDPGKVAQKMIDEHAWLRSARYGASWASPDR